MLDILASVFGPAVPRLVGTAAEMVFERKLAAALEDRAERRKTVAAYRKAIEEWLVALIRNFESLGFDEDELRHLFRDYIPALERFLTDPEVSEELLRPFTEPTPEPRLDAARLLARWQALGLPDLPEDFNARGACTAYVKALTRKRIVTDELRARHQAQIADASRRLLADLRGAWPEFDLDQYARRARQRYQTLDLTALTPAGRDDPDERGPRLRDVFVPQSARRSRPAHSLPRDYLLRQGLDPDEEAARARLLLEAWSKAKPEPVLDLIAADDARHGVVLGDPGAGKSALTRYLLLNLLDERAPGAADRPAWREKLGGGVPFLIELREYIAREAEKKCDGFLGYLHYLGEQQGFGLNVTELQRLLRDEPTLVMFDGLDEIFDPKVRDRIAHEITGFALEYEPARVLVTSRIAGFDARPFEDASFALFTLDDLDDDQIKAIVSGWFGIVFADHPDEAEHRRAHVMETLQDRPAIRALAGNPLLLTIIAIIARHEQLPHSRVGLYDHALRVLCHNWDFRRHLELPKDSALRDLEADHKLALLRRIAWRMQEGEGLKANAIEESDLRAEIERYFAAEWGYDRAKCVRCSREMIEVLHTRNYVLCPYGPGLYGFIHRTFLEYLCAAQLLWRFEKNHDLTLEQMRDDYVLRHCEDDSWHEVIRLLTAQLQPCFASLLIGALTPEPSEADEQTPSLSLAFQCLAEREPRELAQFASICHRLLESLYAWLPTMGSFRASEQERHLSDQVGAALHAIGAHWPNPTLPGHSQLRPRRLPTRAYHVLVAALAGTIWLRLSETKPLLHSCACDDQNTYMRSAAIRALAEHFRDDPETRPLLHDRARWDDDWDVRCQAVQALAEHFYNDPATRPLLCDLIRHDPDEGVRIAALEALAAHSRDDPATVPLLRDCARRDGAADVRAIALEVLAEHFPGDLETEQLLRDRARRDENEHVRRVALFAWAKAYRGDRDVCLLSRDLNSRAPGLDPRKPIDGARVERAAKETGLTYGGIRAAYEVLARRLPLRLTWQTGTRQRRRWGA